MKQFIKLALIGLVAVVFLNSSVMAQKTENLTAKSKKPVLVELFTSEGCSSCPSADNVLARLEKEQPNTNAEIITLALHVDYWNYLGWKDEFSSALYSQRQNSYSNTFGLDSNYTPQMVVDGQKEFVGSNYGKAQQAISDALKNDKANIEISNTENNLNVKISDLPTHEKSNIWLVIAEDNLATNVRRGENSGRTLQHVSVVREMKVIGNVAANDKTFATETAFKLQPTWNKKNLKFVVFVQGADTMKIFGVNKKGIS